MLKWDEKSAAILSASLLSIGLILDLWLKPFWFSEILRFVWYVIAYIPVGLPVFVKGIKLSFKGEIFTEFFLMSLATVGAF
jgi:Cd2+/Zn2+-exporting ATPase